MFSRLTKATFESELIAGLQAGGRERARWENNLYKHFFFLIKQGCHKHKLTEEDSASAYSDTVISVIDSVVAGKFEGRASIKTFIFQIFSNKCIDLIRKTTTNKNTPNNLSVDLDSLVIMLPDASQDIIQQMIHKNDALMIRDRLSKLGDKCRQILLMFEDGYSDKEIAHEMDYNSPAVVKTTRMRCLEKLREMVVEKKYE